MAEIDFGLLRRRVSGLTQRELVGLAVRLGWEHESRRGKGSHEVVRKGGRTLTIPQHRSKGT